MPNKDENEQPKSNGVNRRQFITRTAAGAAGAVALTSVLDACGGSSSSSPALAATDAQNMASGAWKFAVCRTRSGLASPTTVTTQTHPRSTSPPRFSSSSSARESSSSSTLAISAITITLLPWFAANSNRRRW